MKIVSHAVLAAVLLPAFSFGADDLPGGFLLLYEENYKVPAGTKMVEKNQMKMLDSKMSIKLGEQEIEGTMTSSGADEEHLTYLSPDKVRKVLAKSETENAMTIGGQKQPLPADEEPLLGLPVIVERVDGKWSARLEKGEPKQAQREELEKIEKRWNESNEDAQMYGTKPRRVGESWEVDASLLEGFEEFEIEGKIQLKLIGERKVAGQRCAVMEGTIDAVMAGAGKGDDPDMKMSMKGKVQVLRSLKYYEDIKVALEVDAIVEILGEGPDGPMKIVAKGPMTFSGSSEFPE